MHTAISTALVALERLGGANTADPLWRDMPFTNNTTIRTGPADWKPSELLSVAALGYSYAVPAPARRRPDPVLASARLRDIFRAAGSPAPARRARSF